MINDFKRQCNEMNIKTAAGLHDALKRKSDINYSYSTINNIWKGKGQFSMLEDICKSLGINKLKF